MSTTRTPSFLFEEIAAFFAKAPSKQEILQFKPSAQSAQRASELLQMNRSGQLSDESKQELDQFEQAELLIRLIKAEVRSSVQTSSS